MNSGPQIDLSDPTRNMFGIRNCPKCGNTRRWPTQPIHSKHPNCILCDDCGLVEPIEQPDHLGPKMPASTDEAAMGGGPW